MIETKRSAGNSADREIVTTRVINAPRELVFEAFTDPEHIGEWWGPNGFTTTIHEMNVRPGGVWKYIMHGPDGVDYDNKVIYLEIVKPERLVYTHGDFENPAQFHVTVTFADEAGKTRLTMRALFDTQAARDEAKRFGAVEGAIQTLTRLESYLAKA